jgi:hypothetical protein
MFNCTCIIYTLCLLVLFKAFYFTSNLEKEPYVAFSLHVLADPTDQKLVEGATNS